MAHPKDSMDNLCELCQDGFSSSREFDDHFVKYHLSLQKNLNIGYSREVVYSHKSSDFDNNESCKQSLITISDIINESECEQNSKIGTKQILECLEQSNNQIAVDSIKSESDICLNYKNTLENVFVQNEHLSNEANDIVSSYNGVVRHFLDSDRKISTSMQNNVLNSNTATVVSLPIKKEDLDLTIKTKPFLNNENSYIYSEDMGNVYHCHFESCRRYFHLYNHLTYHMKCHGSGGSQYICPECSLSFPVWSLIKHHLFLLHSINIGVLKCSHCKFTFTWKNKLINHIRSHHYTIAKYYLNNIRKNVNRKDKFSLETFVNTSLKNRGGGKEMKKQISLKDTIKHVCPDKNVNLSNSRNLSKNSEVMVMRPKQINKITVVRCPQKLEYFKKWKLKHLITKFDKQQKKNITGFLENNNNDVKEFFKCSFCKYSTKKWETFKMHKSFFHKHRLTTLAFSETDTNQTDNTDMSKVQFCPIKYCRQSFLFKEHLKDHINCHSTVSRNLFCFVCKISFKQNEWVKLRKHLNTAHDINLETDVCNFCSKVYPSKSIQDHYKIHNYKNENISNKPTVKLIYPNTNTLDPNSDVPAETFNYIYLGIQDKILIPENQVFNLSDSTKTGLQETEQNINSTRQTLTLTPENINSINYETLTPSPISNQNAALCSYVENIASTNCETLTPTAISGQNSVSYSCDIQNVNTSTPVSAQNTVSYSCCDFQNISLAQFLNHLKSHHLYEYLLRQAHQKEGGTLYCCPICCFTSKKLHLYCPFHNEVRVIRSVQMTITRQSIIDFSISNLESVKPFVEKEKRKCVTPLIAEGDKAIVQPHLELKIDYLCQFKDCIYKFAFEDHLNFHLKCHTGLPDKCSYYKCPVCLKMFGHDQWYVLKDHLSLHKVVLEEFKCEICSHVCRTKPDLQDHNKIHLICEYCWESFTSKQLLIKHVLTHVNKLWICGRCELVYTCQNHMLKHRRVHKCISEVNSNYSVAVNNNFLTDYQNLTKKVQSVEKLEEKCKCEYCLCISASQRRTRYDKQKYKCCSYSWNDFHAFNIHLRNYHSQEHFIRSNYSNRDFCYCPECCYTTTEKTCTFCPRHSERIKLISHTHISPLVL